MKRTLEPLDMFFWLRPSLFKKHWDIIPIAVLNVLGLSLAFSFLTFQAFYHPETNWLKDRDYIRNPPYEYYRNRQFCFFARNYDFTKVPNPSPKYWEHVDGK